MATVNRDLRLEVAAWLDFYRELGIEGFYRREAGEAAKLGSGSPKESAGRLPAEPPADSGAGDASAALAKESGEPAASHTILQTAPAIGLPARTLGLFEALSPGRSGPETLEQIRADLGDCHRCKLAAGRKHIVFGEGHPHAKIVFVGEGPGADEDEQGRPFVGRAGQLLNRLLQAAGIRREEVYICNVVKCRPPGNRTPEHDEIETCSPFLFRQIEAIGPRLVCCLGAPAARTVLGLKEGILKLRGRLYDFGAAKALATVHPAYVLRNPREEKLLREDLEKIREFLQP